MGQNPGRSAGALFGEDQLGQGRDELAARDVQPGAEVIPESNAQFKASFGQADEAVAAVTTDVTARSAAELAPGYLSTIIPISELSC